MALAWSNFTVDEWANFTLDDWDTFLLDPSPGDFTIDAINTFIPGTEASMSFVNPDAAGAVLNTVNASTFTNVDASDTFAPGIEQQETLI